MIGQKGLLSRIDALIDNDKFPRFSIIVGSQGSGKKTLSKFVAKKLGGTCVIVDTSINAIRDMIYRSYKVRSKLVYIIPDADNMSVAAKNALLKIAEEPPNDIYIIMTIENTQNALETILSRATVFYMDMYSNAEIEQYVQNNKQLVDVIHDLELIKDICETPGEVNVVTNNGEDGYLQRFCEYVELVFNNIATVSLANAFKIPSKVSLKEGIEGYDLRMFWKLFIYKCIQYTKQSINTDIEKALIVAEAIPITDKALESLMLVSGINKQQLMDRWILDVREVWE